MLPPPARLSGGAGVSPPPPFLCVWGVSLSRMWFPTGSVQGLSSLPLVDPAVLGVGFALALAAWHRGACGCPVLGRTALFGSLKGMSRSKASEHSQSRPQVAASVHLRGAEGPWAPALCRVGSVWAPGACCPPASLGEST